MKTINKMAQDMAHSVLNHLEKTKRLSRGRDGSRHYEDAATLTREVESALGEHLTRLFHDLCPPGAILFNIRSADGDDGELGWFHVNVLAGDRIVGGGIEVSTLSGEIGTIAMAMGEFAAEFDGCLTPGQALHAYADALDMALANQMWDHRQNIATGRVKVPPRCGIEANDMGPFCAFIDGHDGPCSWESSSTLISWSKRQDK